MSQESTPFDQFDSVEPMTTGQFKTLDRMMTDLMPSDLPKGFAQHLALNASGALREVVDEFLDRQRYLWAHEHSRLESLGAPRDLSASPAGTIGEWRKRHGLNFSGTSKADLFHAEHLRQHVPFGAAGAREYCTFRVKDLAPSMERVIASFGGIKRLKRAAINPLQLLHHSMSPGPYSYLNVGQGVSVLTEVLGKNTFVFLKMRFAQKQIASTLGDWYFSERIMRSPTEQFTPGEFVAFGEESNKS